MSLHALHLSTMSEPAGTSSLHPGAAVCGIWCSLAVLRYQVSRVPIGCASFAPTSRRCMDVIHAPWSVWQLRCFAGGQNATSTPDSSPREQYEELQLSYGATAEVCNCAATEYLSSHSSLQ